MQSQRGERDRKKEKVSARQQEMLLNFMTRNLMLAKNNINQLGGNDKARMLWEHLAEDLNSVDNGSKKSGERWRKYWTDLKCKVKSKHAEDRRTRLKKGGRPFKHPRLSEFDSLIVKILGKEYAEGDEELRYSSPPLRAPPPAENQTQSPGRALLFTSKAGPSRAVHSSPDMAMEFPEEAASPPSLQHVYCSAPQPSSRGAHKDRATYQPHQASTPQRSPPIANSTDRARRQPHQEVEPEIRVWLRKIEEKRVEAELIKAKAMRENTQNQCRLIDLLEQQLPQISGAFAKIAAALERAVPSASGSTDM